MMFKWLYLSFFFLIQACTLATADELTPAQHRIVQWVRENTGSLSATPDEDILKITFLRITNNNLTELPDEISELKNLNQLGIENTQLTDLPEAIGRLPNLERVTLYKSQFTRIPTALLKKEGLPLRVLDLSNNPLTSLEGLELLTSLDTLYLFGCGLNETHFSDALSKLSKLRQLNLENNLISTLPPVISKLPLTGLYLTNNPIQSLPVSLANLQRLNRLTLSWETLKADPSDRLLDLFHKNGIMANLCGSKLGFYEKDSRQCVCAQTKTINPIREDCEEELRKAIPNHMKPLSEDLRLFRWGGPWGRQLVKDQGFDIKTINHDGGLAAGVGIYLAENPWSSKDFGVLKGTLVEVTLPKGKLYLDDEMLSRSKMGVSVTEIGEKMLAKGALRYSVTRGWWVVNEPSGLSYRLFDGTGYDEATLHQYYMNIKDSEPAREIFIRQIQEGNCDLAKQFVRNLAGS